MYSNGLFPPLYFLATLPQHPPLVIMLNTCSSKEEDEYTYCSWAKLISGCTLSHHQFSHLTNKSGTSWIGTLKEDTFSSCSDAYNFYNAPHFMEIWTVNNIVNSSVCSVCLKMPVNRWRHFRCACVCVYVCVCHCVCLRAYVSTLKELKVFWFSLQPVEVLILEIYPYTQV